MSEGPCKDDGLTSRNLGDELMLYDARGDLIHILEAGLVPGTIGKAGFKQPFVLGRGVSGVLPWHRHEPH